MTPFVIVADLRTGSTLLSATLDRHPRVRCYGELFHPDDFPDNRPENCDPRTANARRLIAAAFDAPGFEAAGFRAMVFLPSSEQPQWADAWDQLRDWPDLRVIYVRRRDRLAQYASMRLAQQTGVYHPYDGDPLYRPENRPTISIDPQEFRDWVAQRDALFDLRRRQLAGRPSLDVDYEALTGAWDAEILRVQQFLGVPAAPLEQAKRKQETRPLSEVIANYAELQIAAS